MLNGTVVVRKNKEGKDTVYVKYTTELWSEPTRRTLYWPVHPHLGLGGNRLIGRKVVGQYDMWKIAPGEPDYWDLYQCFVVLRDQGKTEAEWIEEEPIACPRQPAGRETRYYEGKWQKLLKSGWRDA